MIDWRTELRSTFRRLLRDPGFTVTAAATLGVATAACAIVLAFGWAAMVQPVALFPDRDRLVDLQSTRARGERFGVAPADFVAWREAQTSFAAFGAYVPIGEVDLTGGGGEPQRLRSHLATAAVFRALGVPPARGRVIEPGDEEAGHDRVALLSDHLWRRLGGDPEIVGSFLRLGGEPYRVVGVMPAGFGLRGGVPDLWLPLGFGPQRPADRRTGTLVVVGRLRSDVSLAQARAELEAVGADLASRFPETNRELRPSLEPLVPLMTAAVRPTVVLLLGAVTAVLAVAAVNLGNLLLARAVARKGELAIRASLGAGPRRLARQVLVEGGAVSALAAGVGILVAWAGLRLVPDLQGQFLYRSIELRLGPPVIALACGLALLVGFLASGVPAVRAAATARLGVGRQTVTATRDRRSARVAAALLVGQMAATLALLANGALLVRSLIIRLDTGLGYRPEHVLALEVAPSPSRYPDAASLASLSHRLRSELGSLPGVEVAAAGDDLPGAGWPVDVWADPAGGPATEPERLTLHLVTPGYFAALGLPIVSGRSLVESDAEGAPPAAVLSRSAARILFAAASPVDRDVAIDEWTAHHRVVGVVPDVRREPAAEATPAVYVSYAQHATLLDVVGQRRRLFVLRTAGAPGALARAAAAAVHRVDPGLPVDAVQPLAERVANFSFRPRLATRLVVAFSLLALGLAAVGLYATAAEGVARRRREVGIRIALGAGRAQVVRLFAAPAATSVAIGSVLGLALSVGTGRLLAGMLFGVGPFDPLALAAAVVVLGTAMAFAVLGPVRRSLRIEPREALCE